jgi:flagellin FlaB
MLKGLNKNLRRDERGITGLETAIILIAFVVVASVFAYTVLSAGIFSSQKGQEAVYAGLSETRATMEIKGSMFAYGNGTPGNMTVDAVSFTLTNAMKGQAVDLTPSDGNNTAVVRVDLTGLGTSPTVYDIFTIEVKPVTGASLILNRTLPARIDPVMDLH